jgi:hypothetical protein
MLRFSWWAVQIVVFGVVRPCIGRLHVSSVTSRYTVWPQGRGQHTLLKHGIITQKATDMWLLDVSFRISVSICGFLDGSSQLCHILDSWRPRSSHSQGELVSWWINFCQIFCMFLYSYMKVTLASTDTLKYVVRPAEVRHWELETFVVLCRDSPDLSNERTSPITQEGDICGPL